MTFIRVRAAADPLRVCASCDLRRVVCATGPSICTHCQTARSPHPCDGCGGPRRMQYRLCSDCRWLAGASRPVKTLTCPSCGAEHHTKSGNYLCSACRQQQSKQPCTTCGAPTDKRARICLACLSLQIAVHGKSPAWKGGRIKHKQQGYVLIKTPGHPRSNSQSYVREHTLVMEAILGRYLLPGENVHHINGVRDDNRPENLELWLIDQPPGQRAGDLLVWARRIIATYGPDEALLGLPTVPTCDRVDP